MIPVLTTPPPTSPYRALRKPGTRSFPLKRDLPAKPIPTPITSHPDRAKPIKPIKRQTPKHPNPTQPNQTQPGENAEEKKKRSPPPSYSYNHQTTSNDSNHRDQNRKRNPTHCLPPIVHQLCASRGRGSLRG